MVAKARRVEPRAERMAEDGKGVASEVTSWIAPHSLAEVKELARMMALAEWAPECYRDLDGNYLVAKIELAIMHGASVGLGPIAAVQSIAIINGKPSIWGDGALSVIKHSGLLEDMVEAYEFDDEQGITAICTMTRRDRATPIVNRFSAAMAERAGLIQTEGPWQTYLERMLRMRARSWTMRDGFPDILRGLQIREEVEDFARALGSRVRPTRGPGGGRHAEPSRSVRLSAPLVASLPVAPGSSLEVAEASAKVAAGDHGPEPASAAPALQVEAYTLVDADGVFIEVSGTEALRATFERLLFAEPSSPEQIIGVWESNEAARHAIKREFGGDALRDIETRINHLRLVSQSPKDVSSQDGGPAGDSRPGIECSTRGKDTRASPNLPFQIDPTWGVQKLFHRYRTALDSVAAQPAASDLGVARFRQANGVLEERLRAALPDRMRELDAIYPLAEARETAVSAPITDEEALGVFAAGSEVMDATP